MSSFQLLRTNPLLTTNIKISIDSGMDLYLDSIKSNQDLSDEKYSHFHINKDSYLEDKLPEFYDGLPKEQAFYVKNDDDSDVVYNDYQHQFDDIYFGGADYVSDTWYKEEFEYLSPLYISKGELPDGFIVLRVDNPTIYDDNDSFNIGSLNKDNFRSEIVDKWKSIAYYDMTTNSNFGHWLNKNINENERFPLHSFEMDFRKISFSRWYGMDYNTGVYTQIPSFLDDFIEYEQPQYRYEKMITNGFKENSLIYPHILNLNFLFDDTPATPEKLNKYSVNRYYGFYVDQLEFITNLTSYKTPDMIDGLMLINNIIVTGETGLTWDICEKEYDPVIPSINPFIDEWIDDTDYYIYVKDDLHKVIRFRHEETNVWIYKIISEELLDEYWDTGKTYDYTIDIEYTKGKFSEIIPYGENFNIDPYIDCEGVNQDMYNDLYLIKINDRFHVIKKPLIGVTDNFSKLTKTNYHIQSDYGIVSDNEILKYWIGGDNSEYYNEFTIESSNRKPLVYSVYKIKFVDIKDFDFDRVSTDHSNYDYEKNKYYETKEEKLYSTVHDSDQIPKPIKLFDKGSDSQYKPIPVSSEYISNNELFELTNNNKISDIWAKNPNICKWGFKGSISHMDNSYKLNNDFSTGSIYNRTTDVFSTQSNMYNKSLDYFYRIGTFVKGYNLGTIVPNYYLEQSTNIQTEYINIKDNQGNELNGGDGFNLGAYMNPVNNEDYFDYFDYFFSNKMYKKRDNKIFTDTYKKYSTFYGDHNNEILTLFKNLKISLKKVIKIKRDKDGFIKKIISKNSIDYNEYKFSIILNDIYYNDDSSDPYNINGVVNYYSIMNVSDDGIHVFINEIYKNVLVIINIGIILDNNNSETFNYIDYFNEKDGIYNNKYKDNSQSSSNYDTRKLVSSNFINCINDLNNKHYFDNYVTYYTIYKDDDKNVTFKKSVMNGTTNITNPSIILKIDTPDKLNIKKESYVIETIKGPKVSKLYKKNGIRTKSKSNKTSLAVKINRNPYLITEYNTLYRHSGPYEPIFKDIKIFKDPVFCYLNYQLNTEIIISGITNDVSNGKSVEENESLILEWLDIQEICNSIRLEETMTINGGINGSRSNKSTPSLPQQSTSKCCYVNVESNTNVQIKTDYLVLNGMDFNIPMGATIDGITVTIDRKTHSYIVNDVYVKDETISLTSKYNDFINNLTENKLSLTYWETNYTERVYGGSNDTWGKTWSSFELNSNNFAVVIRCSVINKQSQSLILPDIKCVNVKIDYTYNNQYITYTNFINFDRNLKFDDSLEYFGEVNETIYSKVNIDGINILKFDDVKYPMVDQFGYSVVNRRFIFKSDWDSEFYYNTLNGFVGDSSTYGNPPIGTIKFINNTSNDPPNAN